MGMDGDGDDWKSRGDVVRLARTVDVEIERGRVCLGRFVLSEVGRRGGGLYLGWVRRLFDGEAA